MKFLVLPGDGIGPEIVGAAIHVLKTASERHQLDLALDYEDVGFASLEKHGTTLREELLPGARAYDGIFLVTQSPVDYPDPQNGACHISRRFLPALDPFPN